MGEGRAQGVHRGRGKVRQAADAATLNDRLRRFAKPLTDNPNTLKPMVNYVMQRYFFTSSAVAGPNSITAGVSCPAQKKRYGSPN